jgi:methionyl aminopeptidase
MYRLGPQRLGLPQRLLLNRSRRSRRLVTVAQPDFGEYQVILPHEPFVWGTSHIKPRPIPQHIPWPAYALAGGESEDLPNADPYRGDGIIPLGGEEEARLRRAATLAKKVREYVGTIVKATIHPPFSLVVFFLTFHCRLQPGITTNSIDAAVHDFIVSHSAYPSPLRYQSFPRSCCTSVNNIIAHGVPDEFVSPQ